VKTPEATYLLSELIGGKVHCRGRRIGRVTDMVIKDLGKLAEVTHLLIERPFGRGSLMIPWAEVEKLSAQGNVQLAVEDIDAFQGEPAEGQICLRDHLLDKKVLDCDDDEVEVVYDIKLTQLDGHLYVTDVDCSRAGLLRRIGLKRLSNFIRGIAATIQDDTIPWNYVQPLPHLGSFQGSLKLNIEKSRLADIHPVDLADILEELDPHHRLAIFNQLETEHASDTLEEIEPRVQRELVSALSVERAAQLLDEMTPAQAADVLAAVPVASSEAILKLIDQVNADKIRAIIGHHDQHAPDLATTRIIKFPPSLRVEEAIERYRRVAKDADVVMYIYVTDADDRLVGIVDIRELLQASVSDTLGDIMTTKIVSLREHDTVAEALKLFARYSFRAVPVTNDAGVLQGAIPYRDIMQLSNHLA
jgi:CBS domain-containing protein